VQSVIKMMRACEETLARGSSIMMFPEGTRSPSGRLRNFKAGAFEIALRCRRPLLPIVIRGTHDALPKAGFVLQGRHAIHSQVLEPIPFEQFANTGVDEPTQRVRETIAKELGDSSPGA
jgi:1-acyl-sn-glycerol-3-phosphate acyltransferase